MGSCSALAAVSTTNLVRVDRHRRSTEPAPAQATRIEQNRALATESFGPLIQQIRLAGSHPRLVAGGKYDRSFCVVLKETKTAALLVHIPSDHISGDALKGQVVPRLDGTTLDQMPGGPVFRATRSEKNDQVSYWGQRNLYHVWDGKPCGYDHWD